MSEMKISNTLVNDTSTGEIAFAEQLKDRQLKDYILHGVEFSSDDIAIIPDIIKSEQGVFQSELNKLLLLLWVSFLKNLPDSSDKEPSCSCPPHIFLTQEKYDAIESKDPNTLYFIIGDGESAVWVLGDSFPIILSDNWNLDNEFPIILN